jgi:hypothetical protein
MDAKREVIEQALYAGRLEYEGRPVPRSYGAGMWHGAGLAELIEKDGVRIKKDSLRRWFLDLPIGDRPAFLFDEAREAETMPDGSEIAEMNTTRALAVMAWILSENKPAMQINGRPNAAVIAEAVKPLAEMAFGNDKDGIRGFKSFEKKLGQALNLLKQDTESGFLLYSRKK